MTENDDSGPTVHDTTETEAARLAIIEHNNAVPVEELQALVDQWNKGITADKVCAAELQEVIDEYE